MIAKAQLEKVRIRVVEHIHEELLKKFAMEADVSFEESTYTRNFVLQITQTVCSENAGFVEVEYPIDWWEAIKERWFPDWALKRWPVKYKKVTVKAKAFYPNVFIPEERYFIRLTKEETFTDYPDWLEYKDPDEVITD